MKSRLPVGVGLSVETPDQLLGKIEQGALREFISAVLASCGLVKSDLPVWVINSAGEFWKSVFVLPKTRESKSDGYRLGYFYASFRDIPPDVFGSEKALAATLQPIQIMPQIHAMAEQSPKEEAAEFYQGLSDGLRYGFHLSASPWRIHFALVTRWREVSALNSTTDVHAWLEKHFDKNLTGSRERIAKILSKIQFPLSHKGGRPKKTSETICKLSS